MDAIGQPQLRLAEVQSNTATACTVCHLHPIKARGMCASCYGRAYYRKHHVAAPRTGHRRVPTYRQAQYTVMVASGPAVAVVCRTDRSINEIKELARRTLGCDPIDVVASSESFFGEEVLRAGTRTQAHSLPIGPNHTAVH